MTHIKKTSKVDATLKQRGSVYNTNGTYDDHAALTQGMKELCRGHAGWNKVHPPAKEAIDMILHKIARVINGSSTYKDNWVDVEGYSRLVSRNLKDK